MIGHYAVQCMRSNATDAACTATTTNTTATEFAAAAGIKQEFDKFDLNGDGVLDADEMALQAADKLQIVAANISASAQAQSQAALEQMDTNNDGVVDSAEFADAACTTAAANATNVQEACEWSCLAAEDLVQLAVTHLVQTQIQNFKLLL